MSRKLLSVLIICTLCLTLLTACGKKEEPAKSNAPVATPTAEPAKKEEPAPAPTPTPTAEPTPEPVSRKWKYSNEGVNFDYKDYNTSFAADDGTVVLEYYETMPEFEITGNPDATKKLNDFIGLMTNSQHEEFESMSKDALDDYNEFGKDIDYYYGGNLGNTCSIAWFDADVISMVTTYSVFYPGAAHPNSSQTCYNFDTKTGEVFCNDDLFKDPAAVNEIFKEKIEYEATVGKYQDWLFPDYKDSIVNIFSDYNWFFDGYGVNLIVNPYELAPYSAGALCFSVSYDELRGNLKDEFNNAGAAGWFEIETGGKYLLDVNNDGKADEIWISSVPNQYGEDEYDYYDSEFNLSINGKETHLFTANYLTRAFIVTLKDGSRGLVIGESHDSDDPGTYIVKFDGEGVKEVFCSGDYLGYTPISESEFSLRRRRDFLGTWSSEVRMVINPDWTVSVTEPEEIIIQELNPDYYMRSWHSIVDINATDADGNNPFVVPAQTDVFPLKTDMKSYVTFAYGPDYKIGKFKVEEKADDWQTYVDGKPEFDVFDNLPYAD